MNEHEVTREMTFEEEYKILKEDMHKLLKMEVEYCEPPFANWVARRAYRYIQKLLREIQQYRALGTVEKLREARGKQVEKKANIWGDGYDDKGNMIYDMYDCPNCGKSYEIDYEKYGFCPNCGQAIDWGGEETEE